MATERIRGHGLMRIRKDHFRRKPLCVRCLAMKPPRYRLATELDHIEPLIKNGKEEESNRQGLCHDCHLQKTAEDMGIRAKIRTEVGPDGFPVDDQAGGGTKK